LVVFTGGFVAQLNCHNVFHILAGERE
jgi:hypothetical protein